MLQCFLERGNKILKGGNMEIKCGVETEGKVNQRLPHLGIHLIESSNLKAIEDAGKCLLTGA
jgi:hypothetical protein